MPYRSVTIGEITLLCFPPYDAVLSRVATGHLADLESPTPESLQATLKVGYPEVVVRPREALASLGRGVAWYVYRDGRYSPFVDAEPWWESPDAARLDIDGEGRYVDANPAALELIGVDLPTLRALRTGDLTDETVRPNVAWFWQLLQDTHELHSTSILVTPDGRRLPVEYRLTLEPGPGGRATSFLRAIPSEAAEAGSGDPS